MSDAHYVKLFRDVDGDYRWHRVKSSDIVAASGEGYRNLGDARDQAESEAQAHGIPVVVEGERSA